MADAGEYHRHSLFIRGVNHLFVANTAAGLNDRGCARLHHHIQAVAEREECV